MVYCTRKNVHVDRCASAWLIRRFLDSEAEFVFVEGLGSVPQPGTIPFDMPGVAWGHHGNDCTFETLLKIHKLTDPALVKIARIVHGADITTDSDETLESPGIDLVFKGMRLISQDDREAIERGGLVFNALYAALSVTPKGN